MELNVMSFNIRRGTAKDGRNHWIFRRSMVHEVLSYYRPDVLGLQEALDFQMAEISGMLPGYKQVGIGNQGGSKQQPDDPNWNPEYGSDKRPEKE